MLLKLYVLWDYVPLESFPYLDYSFYFKMYSHYTPTAFCYDMEISEIPLHIKISLTPSTVKYNWSFCWTLIEKSVFHEAEYSWEYN